MKLMLREVSQDFRIHPRRKLKETKHNIQRKIIYALDSQSGVYLSLGVDFILLGSITGSEFWNDLVE